MVIPKSKLLASLIHKVEDQFGVVSVFASENVFPFKDGSIETTASVKFETVFNDFLDVFATEHLSGPIVACALCII